jgi:hypothetical protein
MLCRDKEQHHRGRDSKDPLALSRTIGLVRNEGERREHFANMKVHVVE